MCSNAIYIVSLILKAFSVVRRGGYSRLLFLLFLFFSKGAVGVELSSGIEAGKKARDLESIRANTITSEYATKNEVLSLKELYSLKLESIGALLGKDVEAISKRVDVQDKRIDTQNTHIDQSLGVLGVVLTGLGAALTLAGVAGYFSVRGKAQREAQVATQDWLQSHENNLKQEIGLIKERVRELESNAQENLNSMLKRFQENADSAIQEMQGSINRSMGLMKNLANVQSPSEGARAKLPAKAAEALAEAARTAADKPESEYTYKDWNSRAFDAYKNGDLDSAARFWRSAASHPKTTNYDYAGSLLNLSVAHRENGRMNEAIAACDEVILRFGDNESPEIRSKVAQAIFNKGFIYNLLDKSHDELIAYEDVVARFKMDKDLSIREYVVKAMFNKAITLGQLGRFNDELSEYEAIIKDFSKEESEVVKLVVGEAYLGKGLVYEKLGLSEKEIESYSKISEIFEGDPSLEIRELVLKALINKAFTFDQLADAEAELSVYEEVIGMYKDTDLALGRGAYTQALFNKAKLIKDKGLEEESVAIYDRIISGFSGSAIPEVMECVARSYVEKASMFYGASDDEQAIAHCIRLRNEYGNSEVPGVRDALARSYLCHMAALKRLKEEDQQRDLYKEFLGKFKGDESSFIEKIAEAAEAMQSE